MFRDTTIKDRVMAKVEGKIAEAQKKFEEGKRTLLADLDDEIDDARRRHFDKCDKLTDDCVDEVFK